MQVAKAALSSEHSKFAPASGEEKEKLAALDATVPLGPESSTVSGAIVSTVHVRDAGDASALPTPSTARTRNLCSPSARAESVCGLEQLANGPPSKAHSKPAPVSGEEKKKLAVLEATVPDGPESIAVSGAVVSTVHVRDAGEGSALPTASSARTVKVCALSARPV